MVTVMEKVEEQRRDRRKGSVQGLSKFFQPRRVWILRVKMGPGLFQACEDGSLGHADC